MANSAKLGLAYIVANQSQKEVTHNEALNDLDSLAQISVINMTTNAPPGSPAEGDSYIIGPSPSGAWSGHAGKIASWYSGWRIKTPKEGFRAWIQNLDRELVFNGTSWGSLSSVTMIAPSSAFSSDNAKLAAGFYAGGGGNASSHDAGYNLVAALLGDVTLELRFPIPSQIPAGTPKLRVLGLANAILGVVKFTVKNAVVSPGASPSAATLTSEPQTTVTWGVGDADKYKEVKVTLSSVPVANGMMVIGLNFNELGFTLLAPSTWIPTLIWE
jgi:hypothetical protein